MYTLQFKIFKGIPNQEVLKFMELPVSEVPGVRGMEENSSNAKVPDRPKQLVLFLPTGNFLEESASS